MVESFWNIPKDANIRTPLSILREQATALTEQTDAVLQGEVEALVIDNSLLITMVIYVPALSGYKVEILEYRQPIQLYPGTLTLTLAQANRRVSVQDEQEFVDAVRSYLSSAEVNRAILSLLAQSKSA